MDVIVNFRTGYVRVDGTQEMRPRHIAKNYAQTYLLVDLVSSFPIGTWVVLISPLLDSLLNK